MSEAQTTSMNTEITQGSVSELRSLTLRSTALDKDMRVNIYLPKGYNEKTKYPVLYVLHGFGGDEKGWLPGTKMDKAADELIESGTIKPLIIVSPQIDNSYGINSNTKARIINPSDPKGSLYYGMYEDYIYKDLVGYVDKTFSTIAERKGRYIGGFSMGGAASLHIAFKHSDLFSKAGGHSPALFVDDWSRAPSLKSWLYPDDTLRKERDPLQLAEHRDLAMVQVYLDCGDQDSYKFYEGSEKLNELLKSKGVQSEFHLNPGKHEGAYWSGQVKNYLMFYAGK